MAMTGVCIVFITYSTYVDDEQYRVPTPPGKSWIFFLENSRSWKVLEKYR